MKIYLITKCTTTGYFFPIFSSLLKEEFTRKWEWSSKNGFKQLFLRMQYIFTPKLVILKEECVNRQIFYYCQLFNTKYSFIFAPKSYICIIQIYFLLEIQNHLNSKKLKRKTNKEISLRKVCIIRAHAGTG